MKYYKVLSNKYGRLQSYSLDSSSRFCITYTEEGWNETKPGTGGIFIFDSLSAAKEFVEKVERPDAELWECEAEEISKIEYRASLFGDWNISDFWQQLGADTFLVPSGTVLAKRIKLSKKLCQ